MTEHPSRRRELRVPGNLAAVGEDVVPPADLRRYAELAQHFDHGLVEQVVAIEARVHVARHEAEVQVAEIVVDRAAARHAPHDANAARIYQVGVDLFDGVLVAPDDDRGRIDVEEQEVIVRHLVAEDVLLERQIEARVCGATIVDEEHEERCTRRRTSALASRTT